MFIAEVERCNRDLKLETSRVLCDVWVNEDVSCGTSLCWHFPRNGPFVPSVVSVYDSAATHSGNLRIEGTQRFPGFPSSFHSILGQLYSHKHRLVFLALALNVRRPRPRKGQVHDKCMLPWENLILRIQRWCLIRSKVYNLLYIHFIFISRSRSSLSKSSSWIQL